MKPIGPFIPHHSSMTPEDLFEAFDEDPFLHWVAREHVAAEPGSKQISFNIGDGTGALTGVDTLVSFSARVARRRSIGVGPAAPEPIGLGRVLASQIRRQILCSAFQHLDRKAEFNSIPSSVSSSPAEGVQSGVDRALTPAYRNLVIGTSGEFGKSSLLAVRSAMHACDVRASSRSMQLVVSSPETFDALSKTLDSREQTILCEFRDGHEVHHALCFSGACWVPVSAYRDHASCRVLSLDDVVLHLGDTWTSSDVSLPGPSNSTVFTVATADVQVAFPRLSTHAAVGGWILR